MSWKKKFASISALTAVTTLTIHLANKVIDMSATSDEAYSDKNGEFYDWKFGNIYYEKHGEGEPVLLIHDLFVGSSSYEWHRIVDRLSQNHLVYTIDLLGCGKSEKPSLTYTNYLYVQLITDFINQIVGCKCDVIATGISGSFVIAAAQNNKELINQIILVNPEDINKLNKAPSKRSKTLTHLMNMPVFGTYFYNIAVKKSIMTSKFNEEFFYDQNKIKEKYIDTYYENAHMYHSASKYLLSSLIGHFATVNIYHCMKALDNSIFIISGDEDSRNAEIAYKYECILPSIETMKVENTKHLPQLEEPKAFLEQLNIILHPEE